MLISMTGYCSLSERVKLPDAGTISVTVELKALNGRFFEVVSKIPRTLSHLELNITNFLQQKLVRGRIYLSVHINEEDGGLETIVPSWHAIDQYLASAKAIKEKYHLNGELTLVDVIGLPNVLSAQESDLTAEDETVLMTLFAKVADMLMNVRIEEGKRLEKDFEKIFAVCTDKIAIIQESFAHALEVQRELVKQALAAHPHLEKPSPQIEELQVTLKKMDIHEEVTRFKSHLDSLAPFLQSNGPEKGKRLDFILQELLRETNTMMAKCQVYQVSTSCIDIKVELEKAREQIQNIL